MKTFLYHQLSKLINQYLNLDKDSERRLKKLQGKIITIEFEPFHAIFQLIFKEASVEVKEGGELPAETVVRGTPLQMVGMMLTTENRNQFFAEDLQIEGNAELGQEVVKLFDEMEIDWEENLAKITGDVPSHYIGNFARRIKRWVDHTKESLREDVSDFLHEETSLLPPKEALQDFYHDIDQLRMDVDRLSARMNHLKDLINEEDEDEESS